MEFISFGGGLNSVAMLLLLRDDGNDAEAVFADHRSDWPETYEYLDYLAGHGYEVTRLDTGDLYEYFWRKANIPMRFQRWCTRDFKTKPLGRYMRDKSGGEWVTYIGFAAGEEHRMERAREADGESKRYPLIDRGITRAGCEEIIRAHGLELPMKSGCWFCPFQRVGELRHLKRIHPELVCRIRALEDRCNERIARDKPGMAPFYIKDLPIMSVVEAEQTDLFEEEKPCMCNL